MPTSRLLWHPRQYVLSRLKVDLNTRQRDQTCQYEPQKKKKKKETQVWTMPIGRQPSTLWSGSQSQPVIGTSRVGVETPERIFRLFARLLAHRSTPIQAAGSERARVGWMGWMMDLGSLRLIKLLFKSIIGHRFILGDLRGSPKWT